MIKYLPTSYSYLYKCNFHCFFVQVAQVAAYTLGIDLNLVTVKATNNLVTPNNSVTGGSIASEACAYVRFCSIHSMSSGLPVSHDKFSILAISDFHH